MNSILLVLSQWAGPFGTFAWTMLWQSSLLIGVVFALDLLLRRRLRASLRYALWLVVLAKLALPPSLALPTGLGWCVRPPLPAAASKERLDGSDGRLGGGDGRLGWSLALPPRPAGSEEWVGTSEDGLGGRDGRLGLGREINRARTRDRGPSAVSHGPGSPALPQRPAESGERLGWSEALPGVAGAVSLGLLAWMLGRWRQIARHANRAALAPDWLEGLFGQARGLSGARGNVRLGLIDGRMSPAVCGLLRPVILLPRALVEQLAPDRLRAVLLHELIHLRRGDLWLSLAQSLLQIAYWWHPLLWLANARIRRAREEAVDDAVMLALGSDAAAYAPTLLEVARLVLARPPLSLGLVGILESRTFLRQRIERLLEFRPPRRAGLTLTSLFCLAAFAALALPMGPAPAPEAAGPATSSAPAPVPKAESTQAASVPPATSPAPATAVYRDPWGKPYIINLDLVTEARSGKALSEPELLGSERAALLREFVKRGIRLADAGPALSQAAEELRRRVDRFGVVEPGLLARDGRVDLKDFAEHGTNLIFTGRGRRIIVSKLDRIRVDEVKAADNLTLSDAVKMLDDIARKRDPEGRGINFIVAPCTAEPATTLPGPTAADPVPAWPGVSQVPETVDMSTVTIKINRALHDIPLADLLDVIVKGADRPIKYSIEDYAVVFSPKGHETTPLYFRQIKIDPSVFLKGISNSVGPQELARTNSTGRLQAGFRKFLMDLGLDMSPPKCVFYGDREGRLLVYASLDDIDTIERGIIRLAAAASPSGTNLNAVAAFPTLFRAATPVSEAQKARANQLLQDGRLLYEMGKLDEAESKLHQAWTEDPENQGAYACHYLGLVYLARTRPRLAAEPSPLVIYIKANGDVHLGTDDKPLTDAELKAQLAAAVARNPDLKLVITADKAAPWGRVVEVWEVVKQTTARKNLISPFDSEPSRQ